VTLTGTLAREFFGGPIWVLRSDDGAAYQLNGTVPDELEGCRVKIKAKKAKGQHGISMIGEILDVSSVTAQPV